MTKERGTRSQVVAGATRADRVRARDLLGPLGSLRVAGITRGRYCRAYRNFAWYMFACGWVLRFLDEVDVALSAYVTTLYEEGEARQKANEAAAALQHYVPNLRRHLSLSWSLIAAWARHELPSRALPFTPAVLAAFCGALVRMGQVRLALACIVGFDTLARTGELLGLEAGHVTQEPHQAVISFTQTKRGQRVGLEEAVVISDETVLLCLKALCASLRPGDRLTGCSEAQLRKVWGRAARALDLHDAPLRPYSLRRGGATHLYRETQNLHLVAVRGRWSTLTTTRRYVDDAMATLATLRLSDWQRSNFEALGGEFRTFLRQLQLAPSACLVAR